jgi:hypothetical protein
MQNLFMILLLSGSLLTVAEISSFPDTSSVCAAGDSCADDQEKAPSLLQKAAKMEMELVQVEDRFDADDAEAQQPHRFDEADEADEVQVEDQDTEDQTPQMFDQAGEPADNELVDDEALDADGQQSQRFDKDVEEVLPMKEDFLKQPMKGDLPNEKWGLADTSQTADEKLLAEHGYNFTDDALQEEGLQYEWEFMRERARRAELLRSGGHWERMSASSHLTYDWNGAGLPAKTTRWLYTDFITSKVAKSEYWATMTHRLGYVYISQKEAFRSFSVPIGTARSTTLGPRAK